MVALKPEAPKSEHAPLILTKASTAAAKTEKKTRSDGTDLFRSISHICSSIFTAKAPSPSPKTMTHEEALNLLGVPIERSRDMEYINSQYEMLIKNVTPPKDLRSSPLRTGIQDLLRDIDHAYKVAKNHIS